MDAAQDRSQWNRTGLQPPDRLGRSRVKSPTRVLTIASFALVALTVGSLASVGSVSAAIPADPSSAALPTVEPVTKAVLPTCAYKDVRTGRAAYSKYGTTLLDTIYRLPRGYHPHDLRGTGLRGGGSIRKVALADLRAMDRAARSAGARFAVQSAFRSYATQVSTFNHWVRVAGRKAALKASARPGHSEHQLGTSIDFRRTTAAARRGCRIGPRPGPEPG